MPVQQSTYAAPRLSEVFHEFMPEGQRFIAEQILPALNVSKKAGNMSVITRENLKRTDTKHSNGSAFNRIGLKAEDMSYACVDNGLEIQVTQEDREFYADDFDAEIESVQVIKTRMMMEREIRVKTLVLNTGTWTGAALTTDVSSAPWATSTSDVISHVIAAKEKVRTGTGVAANALILGEAALCQLLTNSKVTGRFPGATIITEEMLRQQMSAIFGLNRLIVGGAVYDGAKDGQAFSGTDIWGSTYAMVARIQEGPLRVNPGLGRSIIWTPLDSGLDTVVEYAEPQTASDVYRVQEYRQEKIFDTYFGHLLKIN